MAAYLDAVQIAELVELMGDDFDSLVEAYLRDSADRISQLDQALTDGNFDQVRRQAHSLKGSSSNLGALQLAKRCQQLESLAQRQDVAAIPVELAGLRHELNGVQRELRQLLG